MSYRWPDETQWRRLQAADPQAPLTLFNLLRFREQADYPAGMTDAPCTGLDAFKRYSSLSLPCLADYGGKIRFSGKPGEVLVGPRDEAWDLVLIVTYPTVDAFLQMTSSDRYQAFKHHRTAAVSDSRLYPVFGQAYPD